MSSETTAKWRVETNTHISINSDQRAYIEKRVVSTGIHEQAIRQ